MVQGEGILLSCSSNGSIRQFSLQHDVKKTSFLRTIWAHKSWVNTAVFSTPYRPNGMRDNCPDHGILEHRCWVVTCSDDREVKLWDTATGELVKTEAPRVPRNGTIKSLAISTRHLFAGASTGAIYVYSIQKACEREDRHACTLAGSPQRLCLQTQLDHGTNIITALHVSGLNFRESYLFSGSRDGTIMVWELPEERLEFERLTVLDHKKGIICMASTWSHMYSSGDDEKIKVWSLADLSLQKMLNIGKRVKCMWAEDGTKIIGDQIISDDGSIGSSSSMHINAEDETIYPTGLLYGGICDGTIKIWRLGMNC